MIATKFPSYAIRHPNKVVWLVHQFRQAYDLDRTELGQFGEEPFDRATVRAIHRLDRAVLGEARRLFAISKNVADRLNRSIGLEAEVLVPPPQPLAYRTSNEAGSFILSVGRLDRAKRIELLLEAAAIETNLRVVVAGDGPDRERLEQVAARRGLDGRVTFAGRVADDELVDLYADCLAVFYAPVDEDLGLVPYEAFLSEKPVVTTRDSGGPLEAVVDGETGVVCEPSPVAIASAFSWLAANPDLARERGRSGKRIAERHHVGPSRGAAPQPLKVAYFSPLPPERSGIADYSALLLPALRERLEVVVAKRGRRPPRGADVALYHVGNSPEAHGWIVDALQRRPGVVVLHDFVLHHLVAGLTIGRGKSRRYIEAMHQDAGVIGRLIAHGVVDHVLPPVWEERAQDFPLAWEVLKHAETVICHSRYVEGKARVYGYEGPIRVIPMPAWPAVEPGARMVPEGHFPVIACAGHLNAAKRIPQLLAAFERVRRRFPDRAARPRRKRGAEPEARHAEHRGRRSSAPVPGGEGPLAASRRLRREREPPLADDGGDLGYGDPHALARQTARR